MHHISVDLETLGTVADAVILSIGAVRFDPFSDAIDDNGFYTSVSIESNLDANRRIQEDTLLWWMKQSTAAQGVFFEPKNALENALIDFSEWVGKDDHCMWSNGADFDLPMLAHAFTQHKLTIPWKHWNSRCVRTVKELPLAKGVTVPRVGTYHNALHDAIYQARLVQAITKVMKNKVAA